MASSTHSVARQPAATSTELIWLGGRSDNNPRRSRPKTPARPRADATACPETTSANDPPAPGHARQDRCARSGQHPQPRRSSARALPDRTLEPWGRPTCQDRAHECPTTRSARATNGAALRPQRAWSTSPADHSFRRMSGRLCVPCAVRKGAEVPHGPVQHQFEALQLAASAFRRWTWLPISSRPHVARRLRLAQRLPGVA